MPIRKRGGKRLSIAAASIELLREAGKPMHALRDLLPLLTERGYKIKHRSGLATMLLRTGKVARTSPGTFAIKEGGAAAG